MKIKFSRLLGRLYDFCYPPLPAEMVAAINQDPLVGDVYTVQYERRLFRRGVLDMHIVREPPELFLVNMIRVARKHGYRIICESINPKMLDPRVAQELKIGE